MNNLIFDASTLAFHKGINTTIRRFGNGFVPEGINTTIRRFGNGFVPGNCGIYKTMKDGVKYIYDGAITNIQIFNFSKIPDDLIEIHHNCPDHLRLLKKLEQYYIDFRAEEVVQVISFKVFFNKNKDLPF